jgi:trimeric autotransporter adhesin
LLNRIIEHIFTFFKPIELTRTLMKRLSLLFAQIVFLFAVLSFADHVWAQSSVSIGTANTNASAVLWLEGNGSQGFIIPMGSRASVATPKKGMLIFDTNQVYYHDGTAWNTIGGSGGGKTYTLSVNGSNQLVLSDGTTSTPINVPIAGDVTGTTLGSTTVTGIQGKPVTSPLPTTGTQFLAYDAAQSKWVFQTPTGSVPALSATQVLTGNGTTNTGTVLSGDASINAGVLTIGPGAITSTKLAASSVSGGSSGTIADGTITSADLASNINIATSGTLAAGATIVSGLTVSGTTTTFNTRAYVWPSTVAGASTFLKNDGAGNLSWAAGSGTVTSVGLIMPSIFSVAGSPITTTGTLNATLATQNANLVFAGPSSGAALAPSFRALAAADIPNIAESQVTNLTTDLANKVTANTAITGATNTKITYDAKGLVTAGGPLTVSDLPTMTATTGGAVPTPPNNTTTFLRGDGTFATPAGGGVTAVSIATANGFNGSSSGGVTPALTIGTPLTGILKGNGTGMSAAVSGTDYSQGTSALTTGIVKSTTATGALSIAVAGDFPTLNQNTTGNAATVTTNANLTGPVTSVGNATTITAGAVTNTMLANVATATFKGRTTAGIGVPEDLTVAQAKALLNLTGTNSGDQTITLTGDVTGTGTGSFATAIANTASTGGNIITAINASTGSINGARVIPSFGAQNISTTGTLSSGAATVTGLTVSGTTTSLNTVGYTWPAAQGGASTVLTNNGTGTLTWGAAGLTNPLTTNGDIIYGVGSTPTRLAAGTGFLRGGSVPSYSAINLASADVSGTLPVIRGGTGITTVTPGAVAYGGATDFAFTTAGTTGQFLQSNGAAAPTWVAAPGFANPMTNLGDLIVGGAAGSPTRLAAPGVSRAILGYNGTTETWVAGGNSQLLGTDGTGNLTFLNQSGFASSALPSGQILVGNAGGVATATAMSGDATLSAAGVLTLAAGSVSGGTGGKILDATITSADLAVGAVDLATTDVTGTLPIAQGGTNSTATATNGGVGYGTGTAHDYTTAGTSGQLLQSNGAAAPTWVNAPTAGWGLTGNAGINPATNFIGTTDNQPLRFVTGAASTERMRIDAAGNVGVGITTPQSLLHINGATIGDLRLSNTTIGTATTDGLDMNINNAGIATIMNHENALTIIGTGNNSIIHLLPSGNVGLNVAGPSQALDVAGNVQFSGTLMPGGQAGTAGQLLQSNGAATPTWVNAPTAAGWGLTGNAGTVDGTNFIGTTDNIPLNFRVNNQKGGRIEVSGATGNTFFGYLSGGVNTGTYNVGFGYGASSSNTTGGFNTIMGANAGYSNTTGSNNAIYGNNALNLNSSTSQATAIGYGAMQNNITPGINTNVAVGYQSLMGNGAGNANTAIGYQAMNTNTGGLNNTATGNSALIGNTTGNSNTAIGSSAGTTVTVGNSNTLVGFQADVVTGNLVNATAIGNNAKVGASNALVLGGTGANAVNVGIGTTTPTAALDVNGSVAITSATGEVNSTRSGAGFNMLPIAYVNATGSGTGITINNRSSNVTSASRIATGVYDFTLPAEDFTNFATGTYFIVGSIMGNTNGEISFVWNGVTTTVIRVLTYTPAGAAADKSFNLVIYKP